MRSFLPLIAFVAWLVPAATTHSQAPPKARPWTECDALCLTLTEAIQTRPETLEMRLEDALVIRRECAGEIVAAALNAVGSNRALRQKVIDTALHVAPEKERAILYAARNPTRNVPVTAVDEEELLAAAVVVKKAIIPEEEIRRAEVPRPPGAGPEIRRAIRLTEQPQPDPVVVEVRRAEIPRIQLSMRRRR